MLIAAVIQEHILVVMGAMLGISCQKLTRFVPWQDTGISSLGLFVKVCEMTQLG